MDANLQAVILGGIAGLLASAIPVLYQVWKDRRRMPQEGIDLGLQSSKNAAEVVDTYTKQMLALNKEVGDLRDRVKLLEDDQEREQEIKAEWREGIRRLIAQIVSLGHRPVWEPKESR